MERTWWWRKQGFLRQWDRKREKRTVCVLHGLSTNGGQFMDVAHLLLADEILPPPFPEARNTV